MEKIELFPGLCLYLNVDKNREETFFAMQYAELPWQEALIAESRYKEHRGKGLKEIRDADIVGIPRDLTGEEADGVRLLNGVIDELFKECEKDFIESNSVSVKSREENYQLLRYTEGQFIVPHIDSTEEFPRKVTMVYYPNDDYTGGEIEFPDINMTLKPPANSAVLFLADSENFKHASRKIMSGTKYAVVALWH